MPIIFRNTLFKSFALRKASLICNEETLTVRVGKEELVINVDKSEKNKNKHLSRPFLSSPVKTSDNFEKFADELAPLDSLPPATINPIFDEMEEDVEIKNSNISDEPVLLNTPLSDKEGYFDSEGDVTFLDNLLSDDASHNLASEVISDHEPEQNESSITFSPRNDPLHHEFAGELLTLPSRNDYEFEEYLSLMVVLCEISTSQSQENIQLSKIIISHRSLYLLSR
ncbi:hypothetical protein Tco_1302990 [Tanacetum coccineum]